MNAKSFEELQGLDGSSLRISLPSPDDHCDATRRFVVALVADRTDGRRFRQNGERSGKDSFASSAGSPICTSHDRRIVSVVQTALPRERGAVNFVLKPRQNGDTVVHTPRQ